MTSLILKSSLLGLLFCTLLTPLSAQNTTVSLIGGGELAWHRLVSPFSTQDLAFSAARGRQNPEAEQNVFPGIRIEQRFKKNIFVTGQFDYGYDLYTISFRDAQETGTSFSPLQRDIIHGSPRLNFSVLPTYKFKSDKWFIAVQSGLTYSIEARESEPFLNTTRREGERRAVRAQNALNRSFGGNIWKFNAGLNIGYGRFYAHLNWRYNITSINNGPIEVEGFDAPIEFNNRISAFQFGVGWEVLRF